MYSHPEMFFSVYFFNAVLNSRTKLFILHYSPSVFFFFTSASLLQLKSLILRHQNTGDIKIRNKTVKNAAKLDELWKTNINVMRVFNELQNAVIDLTIKTIVSTFVFIKLFHGTGLSSQTPWKHQKSIRIGRVQWHEMG